MVGICLTLFALSFLPIDQWGIFIDYFFQTPPLQIIGQGAIYFIGVFVITMLIIIVREAANS